MQSLPLVKMRTILVWVFVLVVVSNGEFISDDNDLREEPRCYSRFDYDFKLLKKLAELEERQETLQTVVESQRVQVDDLKERLRVSLLPFWGDWSSWSDCYVNCTGSHGGRIQSRSREAVIHSGGKSSQTETETETRPCNAVQFAGCVKDFGDNDNYGVTYDFADQIAVSTCTALLTGGTNHVYAVRRTCSSLAASCDETCKHAGLTCFNALHIYRGSPIQKRNQVGTKGLYAYRYNGCAGNFCGPNFCCCKG